MPIDKKGTAYASKTNTAPQDSINTRAYAIRHNSITARNFPQKKGREVMKQTVIIMVEDGKEANVTAEAYSKEISTIFVTAGTVEEAQALVKEGQKQAEEALRNWTPQPKDPEDVPALPKNTKQHYVMYNYSIEEMDEAAELYEKTEEGKRFLKGLQNAKEFEEKHGNGGLRLSQIEYLAFRNHNSLINGVFDLYPYAFRSGYMKGLKAGKAK